MGPSLSFSPTRNPGTTLWEGIVCKPLRKGENQCQSERMNNVHMVNGDSALPQSRLQPNICQQSEFFNVQFVVTFSKSFSFIYYFLSWSSGWPVLNTLISQTLLLVIKHLNL